MKTSIVKHTARRSGTFTFDMHYMEQPTGAGNTSFSFYISSRTTVPALCKGGQDAGTGQAQTLASRHFAMGFSHQETEFYLLRLHRPPRDEWLAPLDFLFLDTTSEGWSCYSLTMGKWRREQDVCVSRIG